SGQAGTGAVSLRRRPRSRADHGRLRRIPVDCPAIAGARAVAMALTELLEEKLKQHESDRTHIPEARTILEAAVVAQFRALARGLFAERLSCEGAARISDEVWWQQYRSLYDPMAADLSDDQRERLTAFQSAFAGEIVRGEAARLTLEQLQRVAIR